MHRLLTGLALLALAAIAAITAPYAQEIRVGPIVLSDPLDPRDGPPARRPVRAS